MDDMDRILSGKQRSFRPPLWRGKLKEVPFSPLAHEQPANTRARAHFECVFFYRSVSLACAFKLIAFKCTDKTMRVKFGDINADRDLYEKQLDQVRAKRPKL